MTSPSVALREVPRTNSKWEGGWEDLETEGHCRNTKHWNSLPELGRGMAPLCAEFLHNTRDRIRGTSLRPLPGLEPGLPGLHLPIISSHGLCWGGENTLVAMCLSWGVWGPRPPL